MGKKMIFVFEKFPKIKKSAINQHDSIIYFRSQTRAEEVFKHREPLIQNM